MNKFKTAAAVAVLAIIASAPAAVHAAEGTALSVSDINSENRIVISEPGSYYLSEDIIKADTGLVIRNEAEGAVTLDLNGKTVTNGEEWTALRNYGTLTITDSVGGGAINGDWNAVNNYGTLTIEGGSFSGANSSGIYNEGGTVIVNNGTFTGFSCGLSTTGPGAWNEDYEYILSGENSSVIINGGTFSAKHTTSQGYTVGDGIKINGNSDVTINGGTFSGGATALTTNGDVYGNVRLRVNGGTFNSLVGAYQISNPTLYVDITGGTFTAGLDTQTYDPKNSYLHITGGTFNTTNGCAKAANSGTHGKAAIVIGAVSYNVTIGGNTVVNAKGEDVYAIAVEKSNTNNNTKTYITGGTYTSDTYVIYNDARLSAGILGILEVTGGTLTGAGAHGVTLTDDVVCNATDNGEFDINCCKVDGGTFNNAKLTGSNSDTYYYITGGTFDFADSSFNLQTWKSGSKYMVQSGYYIQQNDNGTYTVGSAETGVIPSGTVVSAIGNSGTYDQMEIVTDTFENAAKGVTYKVTFTGGDYNGQTKTVSHDFGATITGSVIYGLIIEGIPSDVTAVITVK